MQDKDEHLLVQTKIRLSKAQAQYSKIAKRLRLLDMLEKEMALLEKTSHVIGEDVFASRVSTWLVGRNVSLQGTLMEMSSM